jgi:3-oxoacyl-(acyl-carrier-protein) synthase
LSLLLAADAFIDSGFSDSEFEENLIATIVSGHNLNQSYTHETHMIFMEEPDFIDGLFALYGLDTDHAGSVSELLQLKGPAYTIGAACASGNVAIRNGFNEIKYNEMNAAFIVAPVLDFSYVDLHAMALMDAVSYKSFNDAPERASRPYDQGREGFVPAHGGAVLILEELEHAKARGANIYAELLGVETNADGNHLPQPSSVGQTFLMNRLLTRSGVHYSEIDYISAHATSTQLGDITEIRSIKSVFKEHAKKLKINAPKSMLGHTCWSSAVVEAVAAILQANAGQLHPSINIDKLDSEIDLDICRGNKAVNFVPRTYINNSFGFGGLNSASLYKAYDEYH